MWHEVVNEPQVAVSVGSTYVVRASSVAFGSRPSRFKTLEISKVRLFWE